MSYDSQDNLPYCDDDRNCCELCGNHREQEIVKLNDGDYIKYRCTDCLNDYDTIVIALEAAIGYNGVCHKCGFDTSNKPFSTDKPFVIGGKVLHFQCLEEIIRETKLPDILDIPDLQEGSDEYDEVSITHNCCELAESIPCVCLYSYKCKVHTNDSQVCQGSHS